MTSATFQIIYKVFIALTMFFLFGKSYYTNKRASQYGKPQKITIYSGVGLISIFFLLILLVPLCSTIESDNGIFNFNNIYLLICLFFIVYQLYTNTKLLIYKTGILVMGQYFEFSNIKKARIDNRKFGKKIMLLTPGGGMSFIVSKKNEIIIRDFIKKNRIQLIEFNK